MHLEGIYTLKTARIKVWDFISDPKEIAKCLPGLEKFEARDTKSFSVTLKVGISFVKGDFKFTFNLLEQTPPSNSRFEAIGKSAGVSVHLIASIDLHELEPTVTELAWKADTELGGLLVELSPSLLELSTSKFTQNFFECVKTKLEAD